MSPLVSSRSVRLNICREPAFVPLTPRVREICWDFGVPPREPVVVLADDLALDLRAGELLYLTGPSGSGKSSMIAAIADQWPDAVHVEPRRVPSNRSVIDAVAPRRPLKDAMELLTACGLGEPRLWLRRPCDLSDGERFRAALARAIGEALNGLPSPRPILCDEFTTGLHRRLARALAYNLRKLVTRRGLMFIAAGPHHDLLDDLRPDMLVRLGGPQPEVRRAEPPHGAPVSLRRHVSIEPGTARDYARFSPMHYRHRDGLGFVDKVYLLRHQSDRDPLGILVFAHAPMELAPRNQATNGRFIRNLRRLNRELRILRRLVIHPDVRGCGLGHWFVRNALPRVGVRFVECLATIGAVNPVFEKAGFHRVGPCPLPRGRIALLERLRRLRVDPFAGDFSRRMEQCPRVRRMVEDTIARWVQATQGASPLRLVARGPDDLVRAFRQVIGRPPIYYLWDREGEFPRTGKDASEIGDRHSPHAVGKAHEDEPSSTSISRGRRFPDHREGRSASMRRDPRHGV